MAKKLNEVLGVQEGELTKNGVYNFVVGLDSLFHIDPYLLKGAKTPELINSQEKVKKYFDNVLRLIKSSGFAQNKIWNQAHKKLIFKEIPYINLGYAKKSNRGNAIGSKLAREICQSATEIIKAGVEDPVIFELVGLFEKNVGADRISDMTSRILLKELLQYTDRIMKQLKIKKTEKVKLNSVEYSIPYHSEPVMFVPSEILSPLPIAYDWNEIDMVCQYNEDLRQRLNEVLGDNWKSATNKSKVSKETLKNLLINEPDLMRDLLEMYKKKPAKRYDFKKDPLGETKWLDISKQITKDNHFDLLKYSQLTSTNIMELLIDICNKYGDLIEDNGLFYVLYDETKKLRHERFAQLLFYGIADSYCEANNIDLSREPNAGRGAVDFKLSTGCKSKVNVELKYSTNSKLASGYKKQLPIYNKAEKSSHSIYLILQVDDNRNKIERILKLKTEAENKGERAPEIIIVDARYKKSASN